MNTPEERRESAVQGVYAFAPADIEDWQDPVGLAYDALLRYFDESGQKPVAHAIRYGLSQEKFDTATAMSLNFWTLDDIIDYPSEEDPSPDPSDIADLRADERRADEK